MWKICLLVLLAAATVVAAAPAGNASRPAFTLKEKDLIPEGIAHDPVTGSFFVGSIHKRKIVAVNPDGVERDFVTSGRDGLKTVLGLRVDARRRLLWAMTDGDPQVTGEKGFAAAFKYDLDGGRLLKKYVVEDGSRTHAFNDLAIAADGSAYITDTEAHGIYRIDPSADRLEPLTGPDLLRYPNGITLSEDDRILFVAHAGGILSIDRATGEHRAVKPPDGTPLEGIDGLYFHRGALLAVQNGRPPEQIMRFTLSPGLDQVVKAEVLESGHPLFSVPTTGIPVGDTFYYIANSQLDRIDKEGRLLSPDALSAPIILRLDLTLAP